MQVLLRIANGKSNVRKVRIQADTVIGRSPECQLKVASNQISRRHCQILISDTVVAIKDLGSANGTFVNGRQLPPEVEIPLTPGTRVMLGPLQFTVEYELPGMGSASRTANRQDNDVEDDAIDLLNTSDSEAEEPDFGAAAVPPVAAASTPVAPPIVSEEEFGIPDGSWLSAPPPAGAADLGQTAFMTNPLLGAPFEENLRDPVPPVAAVVQKPNGPLPTAAVVQPPPSPPVTPEVQTAEPAAGEDNPSFNFGIFAASGSGVVVESAVETPLFNPTAVVESTPAAPAAPKPAKKGFLEMLGWGKKKSPATPAEPAAEAPAVEPEPKVEAVETVIADSPFAKSSEETVAEAAPPFQLPVPAPEQAASGGDDTPDESLQNFFNNFK